MRGYVGVIYRSRERSLPKSTFGLIPLCGGARAGLHDLSSLGIDLASCLINVSSLHAVAICGSLDRVLFRFIRMQRAIVFDELGDVVRLHCCVDCARPMPRMMAGLVEIADAKDLYCGEAVKPFSSVPARGESSSMVAIRLRGAAGCQPGPLKLQ